MKWFFNAKIGAKIMTGYVFVGIIAIVTCYIGLQSINKISRMNQELYEVNTLSQIYIDDAIDKFNETSIFLAVSLIDGDKKTGDINLADISKNDEKINEILINLENINNNEDIKREIAQIKTATANLKLLNDNLFDLILAGRMNEARSTFFSNTPYATRIIEMLRHTHDLVETQAKQKAEANLAEGKQAAIAMFFILVIGLTLSLGLGILITRRITRPLKTAVMIADQISMRDLKVEVPINYGRDEAGLMIQAFLKMAENLRGEIKQIFGGVDVLVSSASEISASTIQFTASATETAAAVSETTTTIEELRQTAKLSTQKANYISEVTHKAVQASQEGQKKVEQTLEEMYRIRQQMESIAESVVRQSEQSQAIGEIISSVDDIAEQSNLLAVNASIEAAKAGEEGKGFAVVAQEIKSLAKQSKRATAQVRTILNDIQKATSSAVMATEQGSKMVELGVTQSTGAGESIKEMARSIYEALQAVTQIAASAQQQFAGTEQTAMAMENIRLASNQNVEGSRKIETAARNLDDLGKNLRQLAERYSV
ncbi:Frizzy aggregation protein FrzCD [Pelotomaculum schinkii]|uniref:Frizzy aggregation protein FrzCD n=1 Tax=Pelotomaculum schinkii TaxID=78350 RepID=A0A4Y7REL5_9FIRM|nr:methyl-accepting chemotaxis protein [Pelotomaculum schinkii]TEB07246.1 Frizzy aggregation protein FrzCD [Pelotomaculum schinkii]